MVHRSGTGTASVGDAVTAACIPVPLASDRGKEEPNGLKEKGPVFAVEARAIVGVA